MARLLALALIVAALPLPAAASPGWRWRSLPPAPGGFRQSQAGVWTGRAFLLLGRGPLLNPARTIAAVYDPAANTWRRLAPPKGPGYVPGFKTLWTGRQLLAFDPFQSLSYSPATDRWRALPRAVNLGFVAWTGREAIGWGGGCCGDAQRDGSAFAPATGRYRKLPASPLGPAQGAAGAWTGRELVLFVPRLDVDGKPRPASDAVAAAYDPATDRWRRLAPFPATLLGPSAWDGRELLVVGAGARYRDAYAYDPGTNRWRRLAPLPPGRRGGTAVWAGTRLLLLGGEDAKGRPLHDGLAYDPKTNRWAALPPSPLPDLYGAVAVWTGSELLVANHGRAAALMP